MLEFASTSDRGHLDETRRNVGCDDNSDDRTNHERSVFRRANLGPGRDSPSGRISPSLPAPDRDGRRCG